MPHTLLKNQQEYFASGATLPTDNRVKALRHLRRVINDHEDELLEEISYTIDHTRKLVSVFEIIKMKQEELLCYRKSICLKISRWKK